MPGFDAMAARIVASRGTEDAPVETWPVPAAVIDEAERVVGRPFPASLRSVWEAIGMGFFMAPLDGGERVDAINCLMAPGDAAQLMLDRRWAGKDATVFPFHNEDDDDHVVLIVDKDGNETVEHEWGRGAALAADPREFVMGLVKDPRFWVKLLPEG